MRKARWECLHTVMGGHRGKHQDHSMSRKVCFLRHLHDDHLLQLKSILFMTVDKFLAHRRRSKKMC